MHANERFEIDEVRAGDIAAAVGLEDVTTGDSLSDPANVIKLEGMEFPEPVIAVAVEPKTEADREQDGRRARAISRARTRRCASARITESGQTIIRGMGELHLEVIVERMKREFKVEANVGKPQVAYRETIRVGVEQEGKFTRADGRAESIRRTCGSRSSRGPRARATSSSTRSPAASCRASSCRPSTRACASRPRTAWSRVIPWST